MIHSSFDGVAAQFLCIDIFQGAKQFRLADDAAFEGFVKTGAEFAVGQRGEDRGIDQDHAGMVEGPDQIFSGAQVDPGFAADGGVHLRQHGGGNLHQFEAAHVE